MCGVIGVLGPKPIAGVLASGLFHLQHRGQDAAGLATYDGASFHLHKDEGMVDEILAHPRVRGFRGNMGIAHVRYPTVGCGGAEDAQPFLLESPYGIVLAHNGNLTNYAPLKQELRERDRRYVGSNCDAEVILHVLGEELLRLRERPFEEAVFEAVAAVYRRCRGTYSVVAVIAGFGLLAFRDPFGIKPLIYGERRDDPSDAFPTRMFVSESCALTASGFEPVRDVKPGEAILVLPDGRLVARQVAPPNHHPCIFEFIYFARPDSVIDRLDVYVARERMGRALAREHPVDADVVIAVPDASVPAAIGYARESGIPFHEGLIKNRYIGRTFIQPDQRLRERGVQLKFNPMRHVLDGKRVVVVDDSIVRGTTTPRVISMLRKAGAREVHMRISAPPMRHPCYLGVDTARREDLIAAQIDDVADIGRAIGADSLGYLSLEGLRWAVDLDADRLCNACFTGDYPLAVNPDADKLSLELPTPTRQPSVVGVGATRSSTIRLVRPALSGRGTDPAKR
jgi:amidophosphoribosyltransferase